MATLTSRLILEMVDRVTAPARGVNRTVSNLRSRIDQNNRAMERMRGQMFGAVAAGTSLALPDVNASAKSNSPRRAADEGPFPL